MELLYDDSDCPPENDGYEIPNKPDWNKNQPQAVTTPSTSSKTSDNVAANGGVKNVINELTTIENILRDSSAFSEKQDSGFGEECLRK